MSGRASVAVRVTEAMEQAARGAELKRGEPCTIVIFGATGDLTRRKLMPSLFHLMRDGLLADDVTIVGVGRSVMTDDAFRGEIDKALKEFVKEESRPAGALAAFLSRLAYVGGDFDAPPTYAAIGKHLAPGIGHLFYLAIPPSLYPGVIQQLEKSGIAPREPRSAHRPWTRLIIEKPFGRDLASAQALNEVVRRAFAEHQVYRIDHYLGKETVQNLLVFRFANSIFEPVWNRQHVHHVQITAAETVGVGHRAGYYEEAGVVRDMFQNHLLQLLTLTAMEPPVRLTADAVRDEKVKVLRALQPFSAADAHGMSVRGQYEGYRNEPGVKPDSRTPTFAAVRFLVDNWRWQGVPFFLRSGKSMARQGTEIAIQFQSPPHVMFPTKGGLDLEPNMLIMRIQPSEGVALRFEVKVPGVAPKRASVDMDFDYREAFGGDKHDAYETLLLDCMCGEATLFTRGDEVEEAWRAVDPLIAHWEATPAAHFPNYAAGSWGPQVADEFIGRTGAAWRNV